MSSSLESIPKGSKSNAADTAGKVKQLMVVYPWWFGGLSTCTAVCFTHPLDLIKVQMQGAARSPKKLGMVGTAVNVVKSDGFRGLYRGLSAGLTRQSIYGTTRFGIYDLIKRRLPPTTSQTNVTTLIAASSFSGFIAGVIATPADLANIRMQSDRSLPPHQRRNYRNILHAWNSMSREPGSLFSVYFRGVWANATRAAIVTASQLAAYDSIKGVLVGNFGMREDHVGTHLTASVSAALTATTLCSPVDVLKTQIMRAREGEIKAVGELLKKNFGTDGGKWMFRGWVPSFARLGPQTVVTMVVLEQYRRAYRWFVGVEKVSR